MFSRNLGLYLFLGSRLTRLDDPSLLSEGPDSLLVISNWLPIINSSFLSVFPSWLAVAERKRLARLTSFLLGQHPGGIELLLKHLSPVRLN